MHMKEATSSMEDVDAYLFDDAYSNGMFSYLLRLLNEL